MYVLFWNEIEKMFVIRLITSDACYDLPESDFDGWTTVDDSISGKLDAVSVALRYAAESGWYNFTLQFEGR